MGQNRRTPPCLLRCEYSQTGCETTRLLHATHVCVSIPKIERVALLPRLEPFVVHDGRKAEIAGSGERKRHEHSRCLAQLCNRPLAIVLPKFDSDGGAVIITDDG